MIRNGQIFDKRIKASKNPMINPMITAKKLTPIVYGAPFIAVVKPNHKFILVILFWYNLTPAVGNRWCLPVCPEPAP